nr:MAG TPA: hypothetical protein [Bacteriophage sp.]
MDFHQVVYSLTLRSIRHYPLLTQWFEFFLRLTVTH